MPGDVTKFPGGGGMIIHHRYGRQPRLPCFYCPRYHTKLCDFVLPNGKTCDRRICGQHATPGPEPNIDYCQEHRAKV